MASLKLTQDLRGTRKDSRYPLIFRLSNNQKCTSIDSGVKVHVNEWDNQRGVITKAHPDYQHLNHILRRILYDLEKKLLEITEDVRTLSASELRDLLVNSDKSSRLLFSDFASKEVAALKDQGRYGNAHAYETAVNQLLKFTGKAIALDKISYTVISDFDTHLLKHGKCKNTVAVYMREIRALLNKAIKKGLLDKNKYPFDNYTIRTEKTMSRAITKSDLQKIWQHPLEEGSKLWHCRNLFFLIFNLIGISFIDLAMLTKNNVQNGRIVYRRRKTGKMYSIKITEDAQRILSMYKGDGKYLVSYIEHENVQKQQERKVLNQQMKTCNKFLKKLGVLCECPIKLTSYVARYSVSNVAKTLGYSKDLIAEALGHEYGNKITGIYLDDYGNEVVDEMNERVCREVMNKTPEDADQMKVLKVA